MVLIALIISYMEYLVIRKLLLSKLNIKLDILPDRYYDNPKRNWLNAFVFMFCFIFTVGVMGLIWGFEIF